MSRLKKSALCKEELKYETFSGVCQCCIISDNSLKNMLQVFVFDNEENTTYCDMLNSCFSIKVTDCEGSDDKLFLICEKCISRLKDSFAFRNQIEDVQQNLRNNIILLDLDSDNQIKEEFIIIKKEVITDTDTSNDEFAYNSRRKTKKTKKLLNKSEIKVNCLKVKTEVKREIRKRRTPSNSNKDTKMRKMQRRLCRERMPFEVDPTAVTCEVCGETFPTHRLLLDHMSDHFPNHICDLCGKQFVSKRRMVAHIKMTHDDERVTCQICNKLLKKYSMLRHIRSHTCDNHIYACRLCNEKFVSHSSRVIHMRKVHKLFGRVYKCKMCPKTFEISGYLSKHIRKDHFQEKNHVCSFCNQAFFSRNKLNIHMVSHTGEKDFQCPVCFKCYPRRQSLLTHLKIHNNIKDHVCSVCGKAFTQKCTLQGHMKVHERAFLAANSVSKVTLKMADP